jgi:hypothetical protein
MVPSRSLPGSLPGLTPTETSSCKAAALRWRIRGPPRNPYRAINPFFLPGPAPDVTGRKSQPAFMWCLDRWWRRYEGLKFLR